MVQREIVGSERFTDKLLACQVPKNRKGPRNAITESALSGMKPSGAGAAAAVQTIEGFLVQVGSSFSRIRDSGPNPYPYARDRRAYWNKIERENYKIGVVKYFEELRRRC